MHTGFDGIEEGIEAPKPKDNREFRIHVAIVDHVKIKKSFNVFITHCWQGRDAKDGFFLKMLGVIPGVGDLLCLWRSQCECGKSKVGIGFLEVKAIDGKQSTVQKKFEGICIWLGMHYAIVRSVQEAHDTLIKWGCKPNHNAIKEADTRSKQQKFKDQFDWYK